MGGVDPSLSVGGVDPSLSLRACRPQGVAARPGGVPRDRAALAPPFPPGGLESFPPVALLHRRGRRERLPSPPVSGEASSTRHVFFVPRSFCPEANSFVDLFEELAFGFTAFLHVSVLYLSVSVLNLIISFYLPGAFLFSSIT